MAVQASRKNPGRRGFAATSGAAEQVRMIDPISSESLHQWFGHLSLTDELRKRLWSVSSIEGSHHALSLPRSSEHRESEESSTRSRVELTNPLGVYASQKHSRPNHVEKRQDSSRTHQSPVTLATFPSWGS